MITTSRVTATSEHTSPMKYIQKFVQKFVQEFIVVLLREQEQVYHGRT